MSGKYGLKLNEERPSLSDFPKQEGRFFLQVLAQRRRSSEEGQQESRCDSRTIHLPR